MVEDRIGYRYAKSAYGLASERKEIEPVRKDLTLILETCQESRDFLNMLRSPLIAASKKQQIIDAVFGKQIKTELVQNLVQIIVRKGRERYLPNVAQSFQSLYDAEHKVLRGVLTSAAPLAKKTVAEIKKTMEKQTGQTFEMEEAVDPGLIGGFTLKVGDTLFDGSIASSIAKIRRELLQG